LKEQNNQIEGAAVRRYSESKKKGCPVCDGLDPKTCLHCEGKTALNEWWSASSGFAHVSELSVSEKIQIGIHPSLLDADKAFKLRCKSKLGHGLTESEFDFVRLMSKKYPGWYVEQTAEVFKQTKPFGA
jgi:hypothetical protein